MRDNWDHPFRRPIKKSIPNNKRKRHFPDAFLYNHNIWAVFCEDQDECDDFVMMPEYMFEKHEYMDCEESNSRRMEVMNIGDFIILHNLEDEDISYIGRVCKYNLYSGSEAFYHYACQIEWAELEPVGSRFPSYEYTENPMLITDKKLLAQWRKVIMDDIVEQ